MAGAEHDVKEKKCEGVALLFTKCPQAPLATAHLQGGNGVRGGLSLGGGPKLFTAVHEYLWERNLCVASHGTPFSRTEKKNGGKC